MKNDIEEKLRRLLAENAALDELKVVYLLVEIRKLQKLDESLQKTFPTLSFYCDWAIHTELSWAGAKAFLGKVSPILTLNANMTQEEHEAVDALFTLKSFRSELRALLQTFRADSGICDDQRWSWFLHTYSNVVQDSQLIVVGESIPSGPLALAVKKVTVHPVAGDPSANPGTVVYPMLWRIEYADGRTGRLELSQHGLAGAVVTLLGPTLESVSAVHRMQS